MSDNLEIIMDIETLEVFEVIDLDKKDSQKTRKRKLLRKTKRLLMMTWDGFG